MPKAEKLELFEQVMELEPAKRLQLATALLDSVEEPEGDGWAEAWAQELDRRITDIKEGRDPGLTWDEVRARALSRLGSR